MGIVTKLKSIVGGGDEPTGSHAFECENCGNTFESIRAPEDARCMDCGSGEVTVAD